MARIVVALGGNALGRDPIEQRERIAVTAAALVGLIVTGHEIVVSHGNGPQVGMIRLAFDRASGGDGGVPSMPLALCTAMSQGYIGYQMAVGLREALAARGITREVVTLLTAVTVDPTDDAFRRPTKPIGDFCTESEARRKMAEQPALMMREDAGRGWRQVVASPRPTGIVEGNAIRTLLTQGSVVIACGGGGIPQHEGEDGGICYAEAVVDKDLASARLADEVGAEVLLILTAVEHVMLGFGTDAARVLRHMTVEEAERYIAAGEFADGSMRPKVEAAVRFASGGAGRRAIIASYERAREALAGESGTAVTRA